jgi:hypothetical protein
MDGTDTGASAPLAAPAGAGLAPAVPATGAAAPVPAGAGLSALATRPEMAAEHRTEITIDELLGELTEITEAGFSRHEGCLRLAARCRRLLVRLDEFAAELVQKHNVTGPRTHAALARLAEKVKVMLTKIEEMGQLSILAAEQSESLEGDMFDEYKPMQQETADRGLATPSARVHNEG